MSMKPADRLIAPSRADSDDAIAGLTRVLKRQPTIQEADFLVALAFACDEGGIDYAIACAHAANECDWFKDTDFTRDNNAFGIGHPDSAQGGIRFGNVRECARFYVGEVLLKLRRPIPPSLRDARSYAPVKWDGVEAVVGGAVGPFPVVRTIDDLNERFGPNNREAVWMTDPLGPQAIVAKGNAWFPNLPDQTGATMPTFTTTVPGVPGGPLITTYRIRMNLIAVDGYQRTGKKAAKPRRSVQHGTGNPSNQSAMAEAQYFVNGAEGRQASVHACSDDTEVVVCMPLDEVGWHAADGAGPGNMNGYACEMMEATAIWTNTARRDKLIAITADFMGRCAARFDVSKPERHWDFNANSPNRHHCPDKLMDTGLWETAYIPLWQAARIDELRRMGGQAPVTPTTTTTAAPIVYPPTRVPAPDYIEAQGYELIVNEPNRYRCTQGGRFKTAPSLDAPDAGSTPYKANRTYTFDYSTRAKGEPWLVSKAGSWAPARNFTAA